MERHFASRGRVKALLPEDQQHWAAVIDDVRAGRSIGGHRERGQFVFCRSSGSTGKPKVIRRSAESWIASFEVNRDLFDLSDRDQLTILGAPQHSLTLYGVLEGLHLGMQVLHLNGATAQAQITAMCDSTVLYATPTQLRLLLAVKGAVLANLRLVLAGGGKLDRACRQGLARLAPNARVVEFFGASETSFISLAEAENPEKSVGIAYPGVELEIRNQRLWVKGPYLFDGYEGAGDDAVHRDEDWLFFGEMAKLEDGYLWLLGRSDRMVTIADQNVFPEALETTLGELGVENTAILARPDPMRGHHLICVVAGAVPDGLAEQMQARFGALIAPKRYVSIEKMPMLASGKVDLKGLEGMVQ